MLDCNKLGYDKVHSYVHQHFELVFCVLLSSYVYCCHLMCIVVILCVLLLSYVYLFILFVFVVPMCIRCPVCVLLFLL